jgi:coiled-coil domain-containing protein 151
MFEELESLRKKYAMLESERKHHY